MSYKEKNMVLENPIYLPIDPVWTEREFPEGGSRDDLGIETLGESILADLLPGINNQTRRARYYSFWAWVLRDFINDPDTQHAQGNLYAWLRRREAVLILANLSHGCGGVAGSLVGNEHWQDGEKESYDLNWKSLLSVQGGAYQLYYRGALQETNVIVNDDDHLHDDLTKKIGLRLADTYGDAVAQSTYVKNYIDADNIRKSDIEDFADFGCLCQINSASEEVTALIETFFRFDTRDIFAIKRLASLGLFLDIIDQSKGHSLNEESFRGALYFWSFGNDHAYKPEGNLIEPAQRWRIFQLRQYYVFAIESFWSLFLSKIQLEQVTEDQYIDWVLEHLDFSVLGELLDLKLDDIDPRSISYKNFVEIITTSIPAESFVPGNSSQVTLLNELHLSSLIRGERSRSDVSIHAGLGLMMLVLMLKRSADWTSLPGFHYVSKPFAANRLPLDDFIELSSQALEESWSLSTWLRWFHRLYLWLQHRRVTLIKLSGRKQETAKFQLIYHEGDSQAYFQGRDTDYPKMNAPRFPSALSIFEDLGLVKPDGDGLKLTPSGKKLLDQFRSYQVPEWEEPEEEDEITLNLEESRSG